MPTLAEFNAAPAAEAAEAIRPCLDVDRWVDEIVRARPFADVDALLAAAERAADPLGPAEVDQALGHHPRIGERAGGASAEAGLSRNEQSGLDTDAEVAGRLAAGNQAYEDRFTHVFLIRAAGRSSAEILTELERRLSNDDATEAVETADQLRQIAVLRLRGAITP